MKRSSLLSRSTCPTIKERGASDDTLGVRPMQALLSAYLTEAGRGGMHIPSSVLEYARAGSYLRKSPKRTRLSPNGSTRGLLITHFSDLDPLEWFSRRNGALQYGYWTLKPHRKDNERQFFKASSAPEKKAVSRLFQALFPPSFLNGCAPFLRENQLSRWHLHADEQASVRNGRHLWASSGVQ
jgi:hypothetical protein